MFKTRTQKNDYAQIEMDNYSYSKYWQYDENGGGYESTNLFIMQISPYQTLSNTNAYFTATFKFNEINANLRVSGTLYETTDAKVLQYVNVNNLTNLTTITQAINNLKAISNKTTLTSFSEDFTNGAIGVNNGNANFDTPITIDPTKINYLFAELYLTTLSGIDQQYQPYTPTPTSKGLHISNAEITTTIIPQPVQEIVDIPGLMFTILGLPFSFISQAFDLTIFPNTPYQINFSNLFLGFIGIALLLWVLKVILGQADLGQWLGDQRKNASNYRNEMRRHRNTQKLEQLKHNNKISEQRMAESNRHVRQTHKDGKH